MIGGFKNTAIGSTAGQGIIGGSQNTFLGFQADADSPDSGSRTVVGATATGKFDNSVTLGSPNDVLNLPKTTVSTLPVCSATTEGSLKPVTDSTVNTWGTNIAGGGGLHVLAFCNGTNWTVMAK